MTSRSTFDITWDYPVILWFLAELHRQYKFNLKIIGMIQSLVEPLTDDANLPGLHSNRLLASLALTKLQQMADRELQTNKLPGIEHIIFKLQSGEIRNTIKSELPSHNTTLRYGTSGIAWIYRQLHRLTGGNHFKEEMDYWTSQTVRSGITDEFYPGSGTEKSYGILEGLTGNLLISEILGTKGF